MRNKSTLNQARFIINCEETLKEYSDIFFRTTVADSPKWEEYNYDFYLSNRLKLEDLVLLAMMTWYCDDENKSWLLKMKLLEKFEHDSERICISFILSSKESMWNFLLDTTLWHSRDFFGNIMTNQRLQRVRKLSKIYRIKQKKAKRTQRHRGYRDKGSLRNNHEYHSFVSYTKEMNELEIRRQERLDAKSLIQGFLE